MMKKLLLSAVLLLSLQASAWAESVLPSIPGMVDTDNMPAQNTNTTVAGTAGGTSSFLSGSGPINLRPGGYMPHDGGSVAPRVPSYVVPKISSVTAYNQAQQNSNSGEASPFSPGWTPGN